MLRSDLIRILQERNPRIQPSDVEAAVKDILDHMAKTLIDGGRIEVRGFGSFTLRHLPPRQSRNPKTGERLVLDHQYRVSGCAVFVGHPLLEEARSPQS